MIKNKKFSLKYWYIPVFLMILFNFVAYTGSKILTDSGSRHYDFSLPIDAAIPFIPEFIIIYVLSYVQWVFGFGLIAVESKEVCYRVISSEIIAKIICMIIFLVFPTIMVRADITGNGFFEWATNFIYGLDTPTTLFPSVHCLESWILFRTAHKISRHKKWLIPAWFIFALLVFASVVFVKQHSIIDIFVAIPVCVIAELTCFKSFKNA